jgi:hypothetical protein
MIRSCVRVLPALKKGEDPVLAENRMSFQVGVTSPLVTITNLISRLTDSGFGPPPTPDPFEDGSILFTNIAPMSQSLIFKSLSMINGELRAGVMESLTNGSFFGKQL